MKKLNKKLMVNLALGLGVVVSVVPASFFTSSCFPQITATHNFKNFIGKYVTFSYVYSNSYSGSWYQANISGICTDANEIGLFLGNKFYHWNIIIGSVTISDQQPAVNN